MGIYAQWETAQDLSSTFFRLVFVQQSKAFNEHFTGDELSGSRWQSFPLLVILERADRDAQNLCGPFLAEFSTAFAEFVGECVHRI